MLVLALDTSTPSVTAGVVRLLDPTSLAALVPVRCSATRQPAGELLAEESVTDPFAHAERLMPLALAALVTAGQSLQRPRRGGRRPRARTRSPGSGSGSPPRRRSATGWASLCTGYPATMAPRGLGVALDAIAGSRCWWSPTPGAARCTCRPTGRTAPRRSARWWSHRRRCRQLLTEQGHHRRVHHRPGRTLMDPIPVAGIRSGVLDSCRRRTQSRPGGTGRDRAADRRGARPADPAYLRRPDATEPGARKSVLGR